MSEVSDKPMVALEVTRNGERVCLAGVGEYGLVGATIQYLSHHPDKLAGWEAEGYPEREPVTLDLNVSGCVGEGSDLEHWDWVKMALQPGDEVVIRIQKTLEADPPLQKRRHDPDWYSRYERQYVRRKAHDLGWKVTTPTRRRTPKQRQS
jgi:hypothetical protein